MTPEQRLRYAADPAAFAAGMLQFHPDRRQAAILASQAKRALVLAYTQWGKTTIGAIKAAHHACFHSNRDVLVAAPNARLSAGLVRKAQAFLAQLGIAPRGDGLNAISQVLPNGSRIIGLSAADEGNVRGYSAPSLILIDGARFVKDEIYHALLPMLATADGALWIMSSAGAAQGFFYREWTHAAQGFARFEVTAHHCPRITSAVLNNARSRLPAAVFARDYMCAFQERRPGLDSHMRGAIELRPSGAWAAPGKERGPCF